MVRCAQWQSLTTHGPAALQAARDRTTTQPTSSSGTALKPYHQPRCKPMTFLFANVDGAALNAASMGPVDVEAMNRRALDRCAKGDAHGALESVRQVVQLQPKNARAWNNCGLVRLVLGLAAEAVIAFDQALAAQPNYPEALNNRGRAYQVLGKLSAARNDIDRALTCASGRIVATVLHNRGALRQEL